MHTASLVWLQCSTGETQLFQYFNTVFLEILNAPLRTVFANPVTFVVEPILLSVIKYIIIHCVINPCSYISVPPPTVNVTALNTQTVGDPLELQCEVTTVRGNTSRVDIVWTSGGMELERMNGVSSTTMDNSLVYTHSYTIPKLNTTDDGRVIRCEVVINTSPPVMATDNITLNVTGECDIVMCDM